MVHSFIHFLWKLNQVKCGNKTGIEKKMENETKKKEKLKCKTN